MVADKNERLYRVFHTLRSHACENGQGSSNKSGLSCLSIIILDISTHWEERRNLEMESQLSFSIKKKNDVHASQEERQRLLSIAKLPFGTSAYDLKVFDE
jgi:hypothetical protein